MVAETLIARCIREEPRAQYELYRALHPMMMAICTRYEHNRDDAVARMNEGFLKILTRLGERGRGVPFEPWARRVIINTVIDAFRRERQRKAHETMDEPMGNGIAVEVNEYLGQMEAEAFADLLLRVPPMSRTAFNLFAIDGYGHAEIARTLGISEGTSKWHVSHARSILQRAIAGKAVKHPTP